MNPKWQYTINNSGEAENLKEKYKLNDLLALILANRNINVDNAEVFLNPTRKDFHNPFDMPDMEKAVERIISAIDKKEKITIYGDYDVDGITSITTLKSFLEERGLEVEYYIPHRLNEGYGLNKEAVKKIADNKTILMITVDCGITGIKEIEYAKSLGLDVIVTDHHEPGENIPDAIAVIDCKRKDNKYPFRELAGVGVVFKLIQAISIKLGLEEKEYLKYLDIVSIGTISDIVPLKDENRVITKLGLKLVECTRNFGLKAILNNIGYNKIDSNSISFGVAPRINACGRMGYADVALDLLLSKNMKEAEKYVITLNTFNNERQSKEKNILNEAISKVEKENLEDENSIILAGKGWHSGVIGIVASKITDMYFKPCILFCFDNDSNIGKGSGRSIPGFDIHRALLKCQADLVAFGGHSMAVGVAIEQDKIEKFKKDFSDIVEKADISNIVPILNIDAILNIDNITKEMVASLSKLEPFGEANKMPIFVFKNLKIDSIRTLTEGKHLKLTLRSNNNTYVNAIGFNIGHLAENFVIGDRVDIAGCLEVNSFNGVDSIQINLKDIIKSI